MQRDSKNTIYFCFVDYAETFHSVDDKKLRKILKQMGLTDHLTCLLGNLYAGQEASQNCTWNYRLVPNWERSYVKAVYCHPAYLTYAEYIMQNAGLDEAQAGIKIQFS